MSRLTSCNECEAIAQELRDLFANAWDSSDEVSKDAWIATYKMIGGTDAEVIRAEELIPASQIRESSRIKASAPEKVCS
jgi:hypothetical protein